MAATPLQLAVGYAAIANGGYVFTPHVVQAIFAPETPDGEPGYADLAARPRSSQQIAPAERGRSRCRPRCATRSSHGIRRNITGPGAQQPLDDGRGAVRAGYPADAIPVAGKTGTAQGAGNYPWNDSSAFAAYSIDPDPPVHRRRRTSRRRASARSAAAPVVKCMFLALSGMMPLDPVAISEPLDTTSRGGRRAAGAGRLTACAAPTRSPWPGPAPGTEPAWASRCSSASPTPGSATSAPARPTRAATSTGCCCWRRRALTVAGCFVVFSATRTRTADPYTFVTRQVIFAIAAVLAMVVVMAHRLRVAQAARPHALRADAHRAVRPGRLQLGRRRRRRAGLRARADPGPAGRVRQVHRAAGAVRLPQRGAQRRGQLPAVPRRR